MIEDQRRRASTDIRIIDVSAIIVSNRRQSKVSRRIHDKDARLSHSSFAIITPNENRYPATRSGRKRALLPASPERFRFRRAMGFGKRMQVPKRPLGFVVTRESLVQRSQLPRDYLCDTGRSRDLLLVSDP